MFAIVLALSLAVGVTAVLDRSLCGILLPTVILLVAGVVFSHPRRAYVLGAILLAGSLGAGRAFYTSTLYCVPWEKIPQETITVQACVDVIESAPHPKAILSITKSDIAGLTGKRFMTYNSLPANIVAGAVGEVTVKLSPVLGHANPYGWDKERYYFSENIAGNARIQKWETMTVPAGVAWIKAAQQHLAITIRKQLPNSPHQETILALLLGKAGHMSENARRVWQETGTAHLMAISGLHIGWVFWLVKFFFARLKCGRNIAYIGGIIVALGYAALSGLGVPALRATAMLGIMTLLLLFYKPIKASFAWVVVFIVILLWKPESALNMGFWLSFGAVGLLLLKGYGLTSKTLLTHTRIFVGMIPLTLFGFGQIAWISPLANCVAIPWVGFAVVPLIMVAAITNTWAPFVTKIALQITAFNIEGLTQVLIGLQHLGLHSWHASAYSLAWLVAITVWWLLRLPGSQLGLLIAGCTLFIPGSKPLFGHFSVEIYDVGQGSAVRVVTKNHQLLYDTGPKYGESSVAKTTFLPQLKRETAVLDSVVVSHKERDHIGGLSDVQQLIKVSAVAIEDCPHGKSWQWDGVRFTFWQYAAGKNANERSCLLSVRNETKHVLLTGDIGFAAEQYLVDTLGDNLKADILLVPHHGSRYSSGMAFLSKVAPQYAVVSAGCRNPYGHPHKDTVNRYKAAGSLLKATGIEGRIKFDIGHNSIKMESYRQENPQRWGLEGRDLWCHPQTFGKMAGY